MNIEFFIYPMLLAGILGLWWVPFFFWRDNDTLRSLSGILLWWVNAPLYCLMIAPGLESSQPFLTGNMVIVGKVAGVVFFIVGVMATLFFLIPRMRAGGPGYDAKNLQIQGVFAFMRHPQLASAWFISLGFSCWVGGIHAILSTFGFLLVLRVHAEMEEKYLLIPVFKEDYIEYRKKVKAFVPYVI